MSHDRIDLSEFGCDEIDYLCASAHKLLGGSEATGYLVGKKSAYDIA